MDRDSGELFASPIKVKCPDCGAEIQTLGDVHGGNARLMQAADALLIAARKVLETHQGRDDLSEWAEAESEAIAGLRVAVAFAEGG